MSLVLYRVDDEHMDIKLHRCVICEHLARKAERPPTADRIR